MIANKEKAIFYLDLIILFCICSVIFFLPFAKAAVETFVWMAICFWMLKRLLGYKSDSFFGMLPRTELNTALGFLIAVNLLSFIFSSNFGLSSRGFFGKELKFLGIYFILVEVINSNRRLKNILIVIIASVILIEIDAFVQLFTGTDFLRGYKIDANTFGASFFSASGFSAWLIIMIPLFLGIIASNIISGLKLRVFLIILTFVQAAYLLRTYTRSAWIGFIISMIFMFLYVLRHSNSAAKKAYLYVFLCLLGLTIVIPRELILRPHGSQEKPNFVQSVTERVRITLNTDKGSVHERIMWWNEAFRIVKDYPILGCGINTYSVVARNYKSFEGGGIYPHNSYLQMAAETGLLGLIAFLLLVFVFFASALKYLNAKKDYLVAGIFSGIFAFLVHAFFDVHMYSLQLVILFWFMLGLAVAAINLGKLK